MPDPAAPAAVRDPHLSAWRLPTLPAVRHHPRTRLLVTTFLFCAPVRLLRRLGRPQPFEHGADRTNIVNLGDAIWWGFTTLTTVGYGEGATRSPSPGALAVGLMLAGIAIVDTTTALVVSVLGEQLASADALIHPGATISHHDPDRPSSQRSKRTKQTTQ